MKKILFISKIQFGYNTDYIKYCENLKEEYLSYFVCLNLNLPKVNLENTNVSYVEGYKPGIKSKVSLIASSIRMILSVKPDIVMVNYFPGCSAIAVICRKRNICLDIRTGAIDSDEKVRKKKNRLLSFEAKTYKHISVISEGLLKQLKLDIRCATVIPLGADSIILDKCKKKQMNMKLLYVGTLDYRNIEETIKGFGSFVAKYKNKIECYYSIVGFSNNGNEKIVNKAIIDNRLEATVKYLGRRQHKELVPYFIDHNIGVSYIPKTDYFQYQPPTKTYEYIRNGLICIATNTIENSKVISEQNGVLINEGSEAFAMGLEHVYNNLNKYDPVSIITESEKYSWENIINKALRPYLTKCYSESVI